MEKEIDYEKIIDDEYQFPVFSEDPTEQNRLNVRHAIKKARKKIRVFTTTKRVPSRVT